MKKIILLLITLIIVISGTLLFQTKDLLKNTLNFSNFSPLSNFKVSKSPTPTLQKNCAKELTPQSIEGPYYKEGSPLKTSFLSDAEGEKIVLEGYVLDRNCNLVANAWIDFWQADANGNYDNEGFRLRGHQYTDLQGKYSLQTIMPGEYTGRTIHIHAKVRSSQNSPIITTQLFFPNQDRNSTDPIFTQKTLIKVTDGPGGKIGEFNFITD